MLPDVILEDDDHEVSVGESVASKELAAIEAQPRFKLRKLLWQCLLNQLLLHSSLLSLRSKEALGDHLKDPVDGEDNLVGLGHRLADHLPLVLQDGHRAIWQDRFHLGKIFPCQSDVIKLDPSVCKDKAGNLGAPTSWEVGQPHLLRVARLHLEALAKTFSQFLDHFLSVDDVSFSPLFQ